MTHERRVHYVQTFQADEPEDHLRELSNKVNGLLKGQTNNWYNVTLEADATETTIEVEYARTGAMAMCVATSANAAGLACWTVVGEGTITVHHPSGIATDRTVGVLLVG